MELESHRTQTKSEGYGPLYHRIYSITFPGTIEDGKRAMLELQKNLNEFSPQLLARFEKVSGKPGEMREGDEFQIFITGPWNGPVRAEGVTADKFKLVTLEGHLEAGEIQFRIMKANENEVRFEIESLARSRDAVVDLVYDKIPIAKKAQTEMWTCFCKRFGEHACEVARVEKERVGEVKVTTERRDEKTGAWEEI